MPLENPSHIMLPYNLVFSPTATPARPYPRCPSVQLLSIAKREAGQDSLAPILLGKSIMLIEILR